MSNIKLTASRGFTLVELMIGIVIAAILMLGVVQIFSANKRSHVIGNGLARAQENARVAMQELGEASRLAGYYGCSGNILNHLDPTGTGYDENLFNFDNATGGWDFSGGSSPSATEPGETYTITSHAPDPTESNWDDFNDNDLPASLDNQVLPGTDVLVLKWADSDAGVDIKNMNINNATINTMNATGIAQGTLLLVTDCSGGDAFQTTANASAKALTRGTVAGWSPGNKNPGSTNWSHIYPGKADVLYFVSRAFYIGQGASGEPALFQVTYEQGTSGQVTEELAEGIENMQVLFGIDTDGDDYANRFVTGKDVTTHDDVVALKIALLARTPDEIKETAASNSYDLLGTTVTAPADRRLRYVYTTTVKIRNKGIK